MDPGGLRTEGPEREKAKDEDGGAAILFDLHD